MAKIISTDMKETTSELLEINFPNYVDSNIYTPHGIVLVRDEKAIVTSKQLQYLQEKGLVK